jgi:sugar phosphate isomerase/epimerase
MEATRNEGIQIGTNFRSAPFCPNTTLEEIVFAHSIGFDCIQFAVREPGDYARRLGMPLDTLAVALQDANLISVMEIIVRIDQNGRNAVGQTPLEVLQTNLPIIDALSCTCVHWHLVPSNRTLDPAALADLEKSLVPQFAAVDALAANHGFRFGFEHNEPMLGLFATPERCSWLLEEVSGLGFVWDVNHTIPQHLAGFLALTPRMTMLHISDTPLPTVNAHWPLGRGDIDFPHYFQSLLQGGFSGPAILEIGGLPQSGGYGQDTDEALINSRERLEAAIQAAQSILLSTPE